MALFDDRRFLLSHINHSFITGDDTGTCEVVMLDEDVFENQHQRCLKLEGQNDQNPEERLDPEAFDLIYESDLFESEQGQSYDIASDIDYICHRRRSNTAQRLDRLKKEKINQSRTKTIVWTCNSPTNSQNEDRLSQDSPISIGEANKFDNGFDNAIRKAKNPPEKSGLTRLLERFPSLPKNPFDEYAQFDGGMSETLPVKKIIIFLALTQHKHQPLEVVIVESARIKDLIGLICWQYTNEGREPKLNPDVSKYCVRILEDNGDIDPDFTSLNPNEPLEKFNFPTLALTEKSEERVRSYDGRYTNNKNANNHRSPSTNQKIITSSEKISTVTSRLSAAFSRLLFKDAKLDANQ